MKPKFLSKNKNKKPFIIKRPSRILSCGKLKIVLTLKLTFDFLNFHKIDFNSIKTLEDLSFITGDKELWDNIIVSSKNRTINFLIYLNRAETKKSYIEFLSLGTVDLKSEAQNFKDMIDFSLNKLGIMFIENPICEEFKSEIMLCLKTENNQEKQFLLTSKFTMENISNSSSSRNTDQLTTSKNEESINNLKIEDSSLNDFSTNTNSKNNSSTIFSQLTNLDYQDFDYIYLDLGDFCGSFYGSNLKHILNFIETLKTSSVIQTIINFPLHNTNYNEEKITLLLRLFSCSDIMIFDKKTCYNLLNVLYLIKRDNTTQQELDKKKMFDFFINDIIRKSSFAYKKKICIFLDSFQKVSLVEIPLNAEESIFEYDCVLHPKVNHSNIKQVNEYKNEISKNKQMYCGIFTGSLIGRLIQAGLSSNNFYVAFLVGVEETKKLLEIFKNNYDPPTKNEFYHVKIPNNLQDNYSKIQNIKKRENKFVLDCVNKKTSSIEKYNPLLDRHMHSFFSSEIVRKELKNKGLIDDEGYIMNDPYYKMISQSYLMRHSSSSGNFTMKNHLTQKKNEKQFMKTIEKLKIWKDPQKKEIDVLYSLKKVPEVTEKKIPITPQQDYYSIGKSRKFKLRPIKARSCYL